MDQNLTPILSPDEVRTLTRKLEGFRAELNEREKLVIDRMLHAVIASLPNQEVQGFDAGYSQIAYLIQVFTGRATDAGAVTTPLPPSG